MIRGPIAAVLLACLLAGSLAVGAVGVGSATIAPAETDGWTDLGGLPFLQEEVTPDDVLLSIEITDGGDAEWTIEYRTRLDTEDDETAFEDLRADVEADPDAYTSEFEDRMTATADDAAAATDREMSVSGMTVNAKRRELPREYGIVTYTFRWSNFAAVDGDRFVVGDAVDGLFLDDASELRISWSDDRTFVEATPPPTETRSSTVVWRGPTTFDEGEPRMILDPASATDPGATAEPAPGPTVEPTPDSTADPGVDSTEGPASDEGPTGDENLASDEVVSTTTLAALVVVLLVVSGAYAVRRGWFPGMQAGETAGADPDGTDPDVTDAVDGDEAVEGDAASAGDDAGSVGGDGENGDDPGDGADAGADADEAIDGDADDADETTPFDDVAPELLSNEEQVLRLIEANGGRMKQKRVGEELDWTAAKTSQVTKRLREEDDLKGFRLGRENVLALPGEDPR